MGGLLLGGLQSGVSGRQGRLERELLEEFRLELEMLEFLKWDHCEVRLFALVFVLDPSKVKNEPLYPVTGNFCLVACPMILDPSSPSLLD